MSASELFVNVMRSVDAYLELYETELNSENLSDEMNKRHDARARLKDAAEAWPGGRWRDA